jgi:branched-chain amino acid transport system ATP-binding protein
MSRTLLSARKLCAFYGSTRVLHGIDFDIVEGSVTAFLGANGAGKTSTLRALSGMIETTGEVDFAGQSLKGKSTEERARLGIAHVPEGRGTFVRLTAEQNLRLGAYARRDTAAVEEDLERVYGYFPRLKERRGQQAGTLSGGEQQMLAVGRALMMRPRLMLLDEPSFGLAPLLTEELFRILGAISRERQVSMLVVEQNASLALGIAEHAYLLETGRIVMSGSAEDIGKDESVRKAYLGY